MVTTGDKHSGVLNGLREEAWGIRSMLEFLFQAGTDKNWAQVRPWSTCTSLCIRELIAQAAADVRPGSATHVVSSLKAVLPTSRCGLPLIEGASEDNAAHVRAPARRHKS